MTLDHRLWRLRLALLAVALVALGTLILLAGHRSAQPVIGRYSLPAILAVMLAVTLLVGCIALALLPKTRLEALDDWITAGARSLPASPPPGSRRTGLVLAALALALYTIVAARGIVRNAEPRDDQLDYLRAAGDIRRIGGPIALADALIAGRYTEANRHPLYTALLALRPEFGFAKWLSAALGLAMLGVAWACVLGRAGWLAAGMTALLLAASGAVQQSATLVACEMLLMICCFSAWLAVAYATSRPRQGFGTPCASLAVGVALGLGYLTKASALFLLAGFMLWSLWLPEWRRWSWLAVVTFAVVAAPLLLRNTRAYGDPLYSFNTRFLFADSFDEGLRMEFRGTWPAAQRYWETHGAGAVARRFLGGLGWETFILARSVGPATLTASRPPVGMLLLLLAAVGTVGAERRLVGLSAIWCVIFWMFFGWYVPIAAGDRFLAPIVPVVLYYSARGVLGLVSARVMGDDRLAARHAVWLAALWTALVAILSLRPL